MVKSKRLYLRPRPASNFMSRISCKRGNSIDVPHLHRSGLCEMQPFGPGLKVLAWKSSVDQSRENLFSFFYKELICAVRTEFFYEDLTCAVCISSANFLSYTNSSSDRQTLAPLWIQDPIPDGDTNNDLTSIWLPKDYITRSLNQEKTFMNDQENPFFFRDAFQLNGLR